MFLAQNMDPSWPRQADVFQQELFDLSRTLVCVYRVEKGCGQRRRALRLARREVSWKVWLETLLPECLKH